MKRQPIHRAPRGFTLIEVLVALTVMSVMALMAWQGVDGIVRVRDASQTRMERTLRLNSVIAQWDQDLAAIQRSDAVPELSCDGSTVRMTRRAEGGLQVVAWALRPDANGGSSWWRWASPAVTTVGDLQENWLRTQQFQGGEAGQLRTLTGLSRWQVQFYRGGWSNCQSTGDVVPTSPGAGLAPAPTPAAPRPREALPEGVRIVLSFAAASGPGDELRRDSLLVP